MAEQAQGERGVHIGRDVLGGLVDVLDSIQGGRLVEAMVQLKASHPVPPLGKEMVVAALRGLRSRRGGDWGQERVQVEDLRRELACRPTIHIDIGGGNALLIETGREGAS